MTAWTRIMVPAPGEPDDLAEVVQKLRVLGAAATFTLNPPLAPDLAFVRFDDGAGLKRAIRCLVVTCDNAPDPKERARGRKLLLRFRRLRRRLLQRPQRPSDDELIWRYVCGEIDAFTICSIADWSETDLAHACALRGFSPLHAETSS